MDTPRPLVAVVDDEEAIRKALKRLLRSAGMDVLAYAEGAAFLRSLATQRPDCVVLDIRMPQMNGYAVQARLKSDAADLPIIFITALDEPGERETAMQAGAFAFLRKPFDDEALIDCVGRALAARRGKPRAGGLEGSSGPVG